GRLAAAARSRWEGANTRRPGEERRAPPPMSLRGLATPLSSFDVARQTHGASLVAHAQERTIDVAVRVVAARALHGRRRGRRAIERERCRRADRDLRTRDRLSDELDRRRSGR